MRTLARGRRSVAVSETVGTGTSACVSVVVCAFSDRRWPLLSANVEGLRRQTRPPDETVLVVDHNPSLLERAGSTWPDLVVVPNEGVTGLAAARNSGIHATRGEIVAFIDDDAVADNDWLERLLAGYSNPAVAAVGGLVEPVWESGRPPWLGAEYDWVVGCSHSQMPRQAQPVRNLIGANMSFRRSALLASGAFRESVGRVGDRPFGCEETELCIRLRQQLPESIVLYDPCARVRHHVPDARARWGYFVRRCYAEGRSKAAVTRMVGSSAVATEAAYLTRTLPRAVADGLRRRDRDGLLRAGAVVAGASVTVAGYLRGLAERDRVVGEQG
jgi:GT2 family glycosyltransferase